MGGSCCCRPKSAVICRGSGQIFTNLGDWIVDVAIDRQYPSRRDPPYNCYRNRGIDFGLVRTQKIVCPHKWGAYRTTEVANDGLGGDQIPRNGWIVRWFSLGRMPYRTFSFDGTVMRHFFGSLLTIASLPGSVIQSTLLAFLVTFRGSALGFLTRW